MSTLLDMPPRPAAVRGRALRAAVIGTGKISEEHLRFLAGDARVQLAGVCDLSPSLARYAAARFKAGAVESPAYVTMLHNGVLVHNHTPILGAVAFKALAKYTEHGPKGPIVLQDHGNPVRFRNIWVREIKGYDQP